MVNTPPTRSRFSWLSSRPEAAHFAAAVEGPASLPQKSGAGCPILRSVIAKGGNENVDPWFFSNERSSRAQGFTLLELMIVMIVIGLLAAIAIPAYTTNIRAAKEAVLKEDLHVMRQAIDSYTVDKQKAPQSLDDLVQSGYIKVMPTDPFTHRTDTWMTSQEDTMMDLDQTESGINDVHSGSQETAINGTSYSTW